MDGHVHLRGGCDVPLVNEIIFGSSKNYGPRMVVPSLRGDGAWADEPERRGDRRRPRIANLMRPAVIGNGAALKIIAARVGFNYYFDRGEAGSPLDDTPSKLCAALVFEEIAHGRTSSRI